MNEPLDPAEFDAASPAPADPTPPAGTPPAGTPPAGTPPAGTPPAGTPPRSFGRRHWGKLTLLALVGAPALVFAIWTVVGLSFVYSTGERAGFVQKISKKGWLCKTWEGEMAISTIPGSMPQLFTFSVPDDSIAHAIEKTNGKRIVISYQEKPWVPTSCFGETKHFVTGVRVVGSAPEPQ